MSKKEKYFGSVKFFKNMILLAVIVAIVVPLIFAVRLGGKLKDKEQLEAENRLLKEQMQSFELLSADGASYQELYPDFYAEYPLSSSFEEAENTAYITFQDGPSGVTDSVLDVLDKTNEKATFFVTVRHTDEAEAQLRRIAESGHAIGMYTASANLNKIYESVESFLDDMYACYTWILKTTGTAPAVFRMPGGTVNSYNLTLYREMIAEMLRRGFVPFDWNVSGEDAGGIGVNAAEITKAVEAGVRREKRALIVLHDAVENKTTAEALPAILEELHAEGYRMEPLGPKVKPILFTYR